MQRMEFCWNIFFWKERGKKEYIKTDEYAGNSLKFSEGSSTQGVTPHLQEYESE